MLYVPMIILVLLFFNGINNLMYSPIKSKNFKVTFDKETNFIYLDPLVGEP